MATGGGCAAGCDPATLAYLAEVAGQHLGCDTLVATAQVVMASFADGAAEVVVVGTGGRCADGVGLGPIATQAACQTAVDALVGAGAIPLDLHFTHHGVKVSLIPLVEHTGSMLY